MARLEGGTLSLDIGGSGIKGMVLNNRGTPINERVRVPTPRPADPDALLMAIAMVVERQPAFDRVAIGFPGVVEFGVIRTAPNLDGDWSGFPLADEAEQLTGRPCRVANDADVHGYGAIEGKGVEMVITLGTGMGSAVFTNGCLVPNLELGHHPLTGAETYEDMVGQAAREAVGIVEWNQRVSSVINQILPVWNPRILYIGGGNARHINFELPVNVRRVPNITGILGGIRLWEDQAH